MSNELDLIDNKDIISEKCEAAFLIGIREQGEKDHDATEHLNELKSLVDTMGIEVIDTEMAIIRTPNPKLFIGSGKLEEIVEKAKEIEADLLIFDAELSPRQQRNIEEISGMTVIDRQEVILDIFADRATTKEATLQVQLARLEYSLPRLTRAWTHLSRQRGGAKGTRGKGETQLESDRRMVLRYISSLKKEIKEVEKSRDLMRKKRGERPMPSAAIVGYTNAGKSSLLNFLTGSDVLVEDKLFATLDPTSRKISLPGGREFILTDTVGFIRKLPHDLVDAFKSTLEEAAFADFIIHVLDITNPDIMHHQNVTLNVLEELGIKDKKIITVLNKMDIVDDNPEAELNLLKFPNSIKISTYTGLGVDDLKNSITEVLKGFNVEIKLELPLDRWDILALLKREGHIHKEEYLENCIKVKVSVSEKVMSQLKEYIV
ncbi:MAG: GTPase HflX [Spirochaetaceae bacterium 4572_7]|nr:MAG: GTPase HflX [Spirochaetaceae bacterium 4572_7]